MKRNITLILTSLFVIFRLSGNGQCDIQYGSYINNEYNYQIIVPSLWLREELTLPDKHFMYASKDKNTEIKIRAFKTPDEDIDKTVHTETWDLRKIDPKLQKIIETEKIQIKKNITGKLLIFEYKSRKNNFLQRTLITKNNGIIYIVECISPQYSFYKYEDIFTTAFASFKYIQEGTVEQKSEPAPVKEEPEKKEKTEDIKKIEKNPNPNSDLLEEDENP